MIQPHLPIRLPCYDLAPITDFTLGACLLAVDTATSGTLSFHGLTGGVYKARERIHRGVLIRDYCNSSFMWASCSPQSELRPLLKDWLHLAILHPVVVAIVARVWPRA